MNNKGLQTYNEKIFILFLCDRIYGNTVGLYTQL